MYKTIAVNSPNENEPEKRKLGRPKKINAGSSNINNKNNVEGAKSSKKKVLTSLTQSKSTY
ncbi:hypothetical protein BpHYR1_004223 [Brachionus plicatilis]|uniref:Uncharacterized protein n=1 Tax=Brachionus plicatilis TaxID=10195 RepID=A0A3M7QUW9_BRAPC|nr:hypothetical protein BpHYR1_004223 [Brachionus plicatilis]